MLSTSPHVVLESIDVAYLACFNLPFHRPDVEYFSLLVCSNHFPDNNLETIAIRTPPSGGCLRLTQVHSLFGVREDALFSLDSTRNIECSQDHIQQVCTRHN